MFVIMYVWFFFENILIPNEQNPDKKPKHFSHWKVLVIRIIKFSRIGEYISKLLDFSFIIWSSQLFQIVNISTNNNWNFFRKNWTRTLCLEICLSWNKGSIKAQSSSIRLRIISFQVYLPPSFHDIVFFSFTFFCLKFKFGRQRSILLHKPAQTG